MSSAQSAAASARAPVPPPRAPRRRRVDDLTEAYESVRSAPKWRKILVGLGELALLALVVWRARARAVDTRPRHGWPEAVDSIKVARSVRDYRVGDILYHRGHKWEESLERIASQPEFEGSILRRYFDAHSGNDTEWSLLKRIVDDWAAEHRVELPAEDEVVVHVRAAPSCDRFALNAEGYVQELALVANRGQASEVAIVIAFTYGDYQEERKWVYSEEACENGRRSCPPTRRSRSEYRIVSHKNPDLTSPFWPTPRRSSHGGVGFATRRGEIAAAGATRRAYLRDKTRGFGACARGWSLHCDAGMAQAAPAWPDGPTNRRRFPCPSKPRPERHAHHHHHHHHKTSSTPITLRGRVQRHLTILGRRRPDARDCCSRASGPPPQTWAAAWGRQLRRRPSCALAEGGGSSEDERCRFRRVRSTRACARKPTWRARGAP